MPELLRPDVADQVRGAVGVPVVMAIETRDPAAGFDRSAIAGLIELLLRKGRDQQSQAFELLRIQDTVEEIKEVIDRDQFALGNIAQIGPVSQINRRREFRQEM